MLVDATGEPVSPSAVVRVDVDHRGRVATYLVDRAGIPAKARFYDHAGMLLTDLRALEARESPTEGSLIQRVERHARTVAAEPAMEAAIGFADRHGDTGLVRVTSIPHGQRQEPQK